MEFLVCRKRLKKEEEIKSYLNIKEDYIFVHDKSSTGDYKLNIKSDLRQIKPKKIPCETSVFDWIGVIENAKEIHAINSSFVHLIDSVKTNGKLYYHDIKPNTVGFSLRKTGRLLVMVKIIKPSIGGHDGSSFRELLDMWFERGYCRIEQGPAQRSQGYREDPDSPEAKCWVEEQEMCYCTTSQS